MILLAMFQTLTGPRASPPSNRTPGLDEPTPPLRTSSCWSLLAVFVRIHRPCLLPDPVHHGHHLTLARRNRPAHRWSAPPRERLGLPPSYTAHLVSSDQRARTLMSNESFEGAIVVGDLCTIVRAKRQRMPPLGVITQALDNRRTIATLAALFSMRMGARLACRGFGNRTST